VRILIAAQNCAERMEDIFGIIEGLKDFGDTNSGSFPNHNFFLMPFQMKKSQNETYLLAKKGIVC
jgi:hypothetical protein